MVERGCTRVRECVLGLDKHPVRLMSRASSTKKFEPHVRNIYGSPVVCIQRALPVRPRDGNEKKDRYTRYYQCVDNCAPREHAYIQAHDGKREMGTLTVQHTTWLVEKNREKKLRFLLEARRPHREKFENTPEASSKPRSYAQWRNLWPEIALPVSLLASLRSSFVRFARSENAFIYGTKRSRASTCP
ncbi:hypothetical protein WH47_01885 [Habropoda laboriosa]|uniref:Uncharacterized protein n=1 Tax=Habropoda laboriosa TaxID=597456 RepID=A0A0L7QXW7_9HYME|nr:hypothetical protein WH47_01885 [Habropoda laboriosa]